MAHILIVEDDFAISELIKRNLQLTGHVCSCIAEGDKVVEAMEQKHYDLIILDVMLPGLSGFEIIREIKLMSETPVIFVTAKGTLEDKLNGLQLGAEDYIKTVSKLGYRLELK